MAIKQFILRYFFILITFLGVFSTYPKAVHQAPVNAEEPLGDVIEISTPEEFQNINNDLTAHYVIVNDIDFTGFELTQIAATDYTSFEGTLEGNGFSLKNILIPYSFKEVVGGAQFVRTRTFTYSLFKVNRGIINNLKIENIYHESSINASEYLDDNKYANYSFSFVAYNYGIISDVNIFWSDSSLNRFQGMANEIKISLFTLENRGELRRIKVKASPLDGWKFDSQAFIKISGVALYNGGLIEDFFLSIKASISLRSNHHDFNFSGGIFENHSSGIIRNFYVVTKITINFFIFNISDPSLDIILKISGIVHVNYGLVEYFSITGFINLILPMDFIYDYYNIELGRSVFANTSTTTMGTPGEELNGFTDIILRLISLSKSALITSLSHIDNEFPNSFSLSNSLNLTKNKVEFGHLDEAFHDLYTFVAETGTLADAYTSPFVNDFDGYVFDLSHFSIVEETLDINTPGLTTLSPHELSQQLLTSDAWSRAQLSEINAFVLSDVTLLPFQLTNYSLQSIGTEYEVSENIQVSLNDVPLEPGTHYLNDPGQFLFTLHDPLFDITNTVSVIVYSEDTLLPEGTYEGTFTPQLDEGTIATLNGEPYILGTPITEPGQHQLIIVGLNNYTVAYNFTIQLIVEGVSKGAKYTQSVTPIFSGGSATLNGEPYVSGTLIEDVGNYELIITGVNDFSETISFSILPIKGDLLEGGEYLSGYIPNITGEGVILTLNGEAYEQGTPIILAGEYELIILGVNGFQDSINFTIELNLFNSIQNNGEYTLQVTPVFEGGHATLNDIPFESGTTIDQVGQHTLRIYGLNDELMQTIEFTINPLLLNETTGSLSSYTPDIQGGSSYTLNGQPYLLGTPITTPGTHTLIVHGVNGYTYEYEFLISLTVGGLQNAVKTSSFSPTFSGGTATLNGSPFTSGDTVTNVGHYELIVFGVGDFNRTFNFTIIPSIQSLNDQGVYNASVTPNISGEGMTITFNGELVDNVNYPITNPGLNTIFITGINGYEKTISFTIIPTINAPTNGSKLINQTVTLTWSGGIAELNDEILENYTRDISSVGHYTFVVRGERNDFEEVYNFTIRPRVQNLINNTNYSGPIRPLITGTDSVMVLNGEPYNNERISMPGMHTLTIYGLNGFEEIYHFYIQLNVTGVEDGLERINQPFLIGFSGGLATINGQPFLSGNAISKVGNYELVIIGVSGFEKTILFKILPSIEELNNLGFYDGEITPIINAEGATITLNNEPYEDGVITMPGTHTILIVGEGSFSQTITFTIRLLTNGFEHNASYINEQLTLGFSGGIATLNGEVIQDGHTTQLVGHHTLIIRGVNGFSQTFRFTIHPELNFDPEDENDIYSGNFQPEIVGEEISIFLNNEPYTGNVITLPGVQTLHITSPIGNYSTVYSFSITLVSNNIRDNAIYTDWITPTFSGGIITLNDEPYISGTRIETLGNFTLIVRGTGEFVKTYSFTIQPYDLALPENNSTQTSFVIQINKLHSLTDLRINGESYSRSKTILEIGHYDVMITFNGTELLSQRFTIEPNDYHEDGTVFDSPVVIDYPYGQLFVNDKLYENGYRMDQQGIYTITIRGVNQYEHTYTLLFENPNIERMTSLLLPLGLSLALPGLTYFLRRRRMR